MRHVDAAGRVILAAGAVTGGALDISGLPEGAYLVRAATAETPAWAPPAKT